MLPNLYRLHLAESWPQYCFSVAFRDFTLQPYLFRHILLYLSSKDVARISCVGTMCSKFVNEDVVSYNSLLHPNSFVSRFGKRCLSASDPSLPLLHLTSSGRSKVETCSSEIGDRCMLGICAIRGLPKQLYDKMLDLSES